MAPAKINLFLKVLGKRDDFYHEIETLMCCIALFDIVFIKFLDSGSKICVQCSDPDIAGGENNLAYKAAKSFFSRIDQKIGIYIYIQKNIPTGAGLGGGSSDAACVLLSLNRYFKKPFSKKDLAKIGLEIGADVPFFIEQKPAIASGIGEKLTFYHGLDNFWVTSIFPEKKLSTASVYKNVNLTLTKNKNRLNYLNLKESSFNVKTDLYNDLEISACALFPEIIEIKKRLIELGALGSLMSGSGSSVFGLFKEYSIARKAGAAFYQKKGWKIYITELLTFASSVI